MGIEFKFCDSKKASSPYCSHELGLSNPLVTNFTCFDDLPYPLLIIPTFFPIDCKCKAKNSTVGVFPDPPVVIFPTLMTLQGNLLVLKIFVSYK